MGDACDVHCQPWDIGLCKIGRLFNTLAFFGCDEDGVVTFDLAVSFKLGWFVLERLLVL